jgi:lactate dehydrogenase-like 2-hydroxyacid dehydrogenase
LAEALGSGGIWAAGLDVFEDEPRVHEGLKGLDNVVMTPHFGSGSFGSRGEMARLVAANVRSVLGGGEPLTAVV